jgi:List-Bact-rpt repeat protein
VQLSATAAPGYAFLNWAGDCQGTSSTCAVTADAPKYVLPVFAPIQQFEVRVKGPGTVEVDGADCLRTCTTDHAQGTTVELVAHPNRKASFSGWSDRCRTDAKRCVAVVKQRNVVIATFTKP